MNYYMKGLDEYILIKGKPSLHLKKYAASSFLGGNQPNHNKYTIMKNFVAGLAKYDNVIFLHPSHMGQINTITGIHKIYVDYYGDNKILDNVRNNPDKMFIVVNMEGEKNGSLILNYNSISIDSPFFNTICRKNTIDTILSDLK